jgi:hypothetical protein
MNFKWLQNVSSDYVERFKEAATCIVMDEVSDTDDENKKTLIEFTARDMAMGAMLKRNEHIITGIGIGIIGTALTFVVSSKVMGLRHKKRENLYYDADKDRNRKDKVDVEIAYDEVSVSEDIVERVNEILKKDSNLEELKTIIQEIRDNEKK